MRELENEIEVEAALNNFEKNTKDLLVIDGETLGRCLHSEVLKSRFFSLAARCPSVCVCRCSPTQKADIVREIKNYTSNRVAAIGDGGNDVGMI